MTPPTPSAQTVTADDRQKLAQEIWAGLKSYMLEECSLGCAAVSSADEKNLTNLILNYIPNVATLTSSLAAAEALVGELEKQIRAALKIVGEPSSGHRMMSSRRDACTVWKLLSSALSQTEEGPDRQVALDGEGKPVHFEKAKP